MKNIVRLLFPAVIFLMISACAGRQSNTGMRASTAANPVVLSGNGTSVIPVDNINTNTTGNSLIRTSGTTSTAANATAPGMATANSSGSYTMEMANADDAAIARNKAKEFMQESALVNSSVIILSKLALENTQQVEVKNFAAILIKDRSELEMELNTLAQTKKMSISTGSGVSGLPAIVRDKVEKLKNSSSNEFDRTYLELIVKDYRRTVGLFEQATKATDPKVKTFAAQQLPSLKIHLQQAIVLSKK